MSSRARFTLVSLFLAATIGISASAAQAASFGVEEKNFEAGTCTTETCTYASIEKDHSEAFTQAAGHPPFGITTFELNSEPGTLGVGKKPVGDVKNIRVDLPPGLAADPQALEQCPLAAFESDECESKYPGSRVGTDELEVYAEELGAGLNLPISAPVYDLVQPKGESGLPLDFGIHAEVPGVANEHILLEGHVSWSTDYHEYFEIKNVTKETPLLKSKLIFKGTAGNGNFLTLPSACASSETSRLTLESYEGVKTETLTHTPIGVEGCGNVPFSPQAEVSAAAGESGSDLPDGITAQVKVPQKAGAGETNTADIQNVRVTFPEGLTLNPSAAKGLETCTEAQIGIGTENTVGCPAGSKIGTATIETDLPPGSLSGNVYLASPKGGTIKAPPFTIYVDATSEYDVQVRLKGTVTPNPTTGRLETSFLENPQLPFSDFILKLNGGPTAPLANPLACTTGYTESAFTPYTGAAEALSKTPFAATGCASSLPFALTQGASVAPATAGAKSAFTFTLGRNSGEQYLSQVKTTLPPGLVGEIPAVKQCSEAEIKAAEANTGECSAETEIGTANVTAGAGTEPESFAGHVYLTGPYDGAPFGLAIVVPATAGPFELGSVVTRAAIAINQETAQVTVTSTLPTIHAGVPLRVRSIAIAVSKPGFMLNPTNCSAFNTESTLTSTLGATDALKTPFQVSGCSALAFKPTFGAASLATSAKVAKDFGTSLETTINVPAGDANIKSVLVQLPLQLPSRDSTLKKACVAATFEKNPYECPSGSFVGGVRANTPTLASKLKGPAVLVSHGGEAFPDLDLVLEAEGVRVIVVGHTKITKGITTTDFASTPDVPVSSITVNLPIGEHSALALDGELCHKQLLMPTTITAQNGVVFKQSTVIKVANCGVKIVGHKVIGNTAYITVQTFAAGRVSGSGKSLATVYEHFKKARKTATLKVRLSKKGKGRRRPFKVKLRVGFLPKQKGAATSAASATVKFK